MDSMALRRLISAESRAVAEGVNRTLFLWEGKQFQFCIQLEDCEDGTYIGEPV